MTSPLDNLAGATGSLLKEAPDADEYAGLIRSATVRLIDAERADNSVESRFDLAYNAAHALCLAALRRAGYRAHNRYIVFQAVPHTLRLGPEVWRVLAKWHQIRNQGEYEGDLNVDERLVADPSSPARQSRMPWHSFLLSPDWTSTAKRCFPSENL